MPLNELELKSNRRAITIESAEEITDTEEAVQTLGRDINAMHAVVSLRSIIMEQKSVNPLQYDYDILAMDDRLWHQTIRFASDGVTFTFDVSDRWHLEEFALQRPIRDAMLQLVRNFGMNKFTCKYENV